MVLGALLVTSGMILCYTTKGEYYNAEEVQAMVAAEVLEEEKKKRAENEEAERAIRESMGKTAAEEGIGGAPADGGDAEEGMGGGDGLGEECSPEEAKAAAVARKKKRGPMIAS